MATRKSVTESRAVKGPRKRLQDYIDENTNLKAQLERLLQPVNVCAGSPIESPQSDAHKLTEQLENLQSEVDRHRQEMAFHGAEHAKHKDLHNVALLNHAGLTQRLVAAVAIKSVIA